MGEDDRARLHDAYRFLRDLEHRIQLWDLRQTHELPTTHSVGSSWGVPRHADRTGSPARTEARGGEIGGPRSMSGSTSDRFWTPWSDLRARLGMEQAALRLEALGFNDVAAAKRALEDLTAGLSRRSQAMQQVLP